MFMRKEMRRRAYKEIKLFGISLLLGVGLAFLANSFELLREQAGWVGGMDEGKVFALVLFPYFLLFS